MPSADLNYIEIIESKGYLLVLTNEIAIYNLVSL